MQKIDSVKGQSAGIYQFLNKAFNLSLLENHRLKWVDYLKGVAIILVVYRHVLIGIERTGLAIPDYLVKANMIFYSFRMPLFFILSGIFISSSLLKRSFSQIINSKFERLIYPYLVWAFLQITLQIVFSRYTNAERTLLDYTYIIYHPRNLDQFWYLPALFNVTVIYLFIKLKFKPASLTHLALAILFYYISPLFHGISMISDWMEFYIFFALGDIFSTLFFDGKIQTLLKKNFVLLLVTPVFILLQIFYLSHPEEYFMNEMIGRTEFIFISLFGCLTMFALSFKIQHLNGLSFLRIVGYHSLYIYVMHVFVSAFVRIMLMKIFQITNAPLLLLSGIVLSITLSIAFYNLLIRNNILWFLFSYKKKTLNSLPVKAKAATD